MTQLNSDSCFVKMNRFARHRREKKSHSLAVSFCFCVTVLASGCVCVMGQLAAVWVIIVFLCYEGGRQNTRRRETI